MEVGWFGGEIFGEDWSMDLDAEDSKLQDEVGSCGSSSLA